MRYGGRAALVTGASSGIGEAFAQELARRGMRLLLTALPAHEEDLLAVAGRIAALHGTRVDTLAIDLSVRGAAQAVQASADARGFEPDLLVNNAGIGASHAVADGSVEGQLDIVRVNVEALVGLTALYLPRMIARRDGAVINVASAAAFQPMPYSAVYAASKAFVVSFTEAVWAETHPHGVRVVAVCPGIVITHFHGGLTQLADAPSTWAALAGVGRFLRWVGLKPLSVEMVVARALAGLERDRPLSVRRAPGAFLIYIPSRLLARALPRRQRLLTLARFFKPRDAARESQGLAEPPSRP